MLFSPCVILTYIMRFYSYLHGVIMGFFTCSTAKSEFLGKCNKALHDSFFDLKDIGADGKLTSDEIYWLAEFISKNSSITSLKFLLEATDDNYKAFSNLAKVIKANDKIQKLELRIYNNFERLHSDVFEFVLLFLSWLIERNNNSKLDKLNNDVLEMIDNKPHLQELSINPANSFSTRQQAEVLQKKINNMHELRKLDLPFYLIKPISVPETVRDLSIDLSSLDASSFSTMQPLHALKLAPLNLTNDSLETLVNIIEVNAKTLESLEISYENRQILTLESKFFNAIKACHHLKKNQLG